MTNDNYLSRAKNKKHFQGNSPASMDAHSPMQARTVNFIVFWKVKTSDEVGV
jgi:hypothetical protein